jgi:hypothetical protein
MFSIFLVVSAPSLSSWIQLFFVGVILLPILIINREQMRLSKLALVALLLLPFLVVPATVEAFDLFINCDWDSLVNTYGEAGAWLFWIWGGC